MSRRRAIRLGIPAFLCLVGFYLVGSSDYKEAFGSAPVQLKAQVPYSLAVADPAFAVSTADTEDSVRFDTVRLPVEDSVQPGETLSDVFVGLGLGTAEALEAVGAVAEHLDVRRLRAGSSYLATYDPELRLVGWQLPLEAQGGKLVLARRGDDLTGDWVARLEPFVESTENRTVTGVLRGSLSESIERAGGPPSLAYRMAEVLQWDLDFTRDLRSGDRFEVLFEEVWRDREYQGPGEILALSYDNMGREIEAFRFGKEAGYYDGEGRPLKKMFLRSPMRFTRVTSKFSHRRFHPILKRYRPHYGIDYGAPTGTPVRVTANGVVSFAARKGGAGNMVKVRHPNGYLSAYLHLSRFAEGVRTGARVAQGDVIGYVGSTGLSTGPHLDYRVQKNGTWIDPMTLKSVPAQPISVALWADFEAYRNAARSALAQQVPFRSPSLSPRTDDGVRFAHQGGATDETSGARLETGSLPSVAGR